MKKPIITLILATMFTSLFAQRVVYTKDNKKQNFQKEEIFLTFSESSIKFEQKEGQEIGLATLLPTAVDLGFKLTTSILENRKEKFSAEYTVQNSYLEAGNNTVPHIEFNRKIDDNVGIRVQIIAEKLNNLDGYIYYIQEIELHYSKAKTTVNSRLFDYTMEIKPTFIVNGEKKSQELGALTINSVGFGLNKFPEKKYRTSIIPLPKGGIISEVFIKVIETNPAKVNAEKILSVYNDYKGDAKTIINNFIKSEDSGKSGDNDNVDPDAPVSN